MSTMKSGHELAVLSTNKSGRSVSPNGSTAALNGGNAKKKETKSWKEYYYGPRDMNHHSKWPFVFRLHGSVTPELIMPLLLVAAWTTAIWAIDHYSGENSTSTQRRKPRALHFDSILLTVLGFVVGLSLSLRSSTAYERWTEGRKYWAQLQLTSQNFARLIWVHCVEREGDDAKDDLLTKITCLNLIVAYSLAMKHRLRFEPYVNYPDMEPYVEYLDTFAKEANKGVDLTQPKDSVWMKVGDFLGMPWAEKNPRRQIKLAQKPLGNLPLEILNHISGYIDGAIINGQLKTPIFQVQALTSITTMNDILTGCDRVLNTPLPVAYSIAISQITWVYILALPFQLIQKLQWKVIPATLVAAYIMLSLITIGREIENPFGDDVNDLPLEAYCDQIATDIDIISSSPAPKASEFAKRAQNLPLYPLSGNGYQAWAASDESEIRDALRAKVGMRHYNQKHDQAYSSGRDMNEV
ncbi:UPF0187-domain-containing protein [Tothia fuscella]|uniref:UPF0187-domain-containing protein n=1 Tax=Tothia fuscella TaxID=1048955 RepID=A0A9P4NTN1_9PEZI|nr:UPF0187-domain-containing protein [Tothia fuscella]